MASLPTCEVCGSKTNMFMMRSVYECASCLKHICDRCTAKCRRKREEGLDSRILSSRSMRKDYRVCRACENKRNIQKETKERSRTTVRHFDVKSYIRRSRKKSDMYVPIYLARLPDTPDVAEPAKNDRHVVKRERQTSGSCLRNIVVRRKSCLAYATKPKRSSSSWSTSSDDLDPLAEMQLHINFWHRGLTSIMQRPRISDSKRTGATVSGNIPTSTSFHPGSSMRAGKITICKYDS